MVRVLYFTFHGTNAQPRLLGQQTIYAGPDKAHHPAVGEVGKVEGDRVASSRTQGSGMRRAVSGLLRRLASMATSRSTAVSAPHSLPQAAELCPDPRRKRRCS